MQRPWTRYQEGRRQSVRVRQRVHHRGVRPWYLLRWYELHQAAARGGVHHGIELRLQLLRRRHLLQPGMHRRVRRLQLALEDGRM
jgi:hypothetical protein